MVTSHSEGQRPHRAGLTRRELLLKGGGTAVVGGASLAALLAACTSDDAEEATATRAAAGAAGIIGGGFEGGQLLWSNYFSTGSFWAAHKQGFEDVLEVLGGGSFDARGPEDGDSAAQIEVMERAISAGTPMAVAASESAVIAPVIDRAIEAGVPVVTIDAGASESKRLSHIGTGNREAGYAAGKRVILEMGGTGDIILTRATGIEAFGLREQGFVEAVDEEGGAVRIVATVNDFDNNERALPVVQQALQANPDASGIFTISAGAGLGTVQAVRESGREGLRVGVFSNEIPVFQELLSPGTSLAFSIKQDGYKMGFFSGLLLQVAAKQLSQPDYDFEALGSSTLPFSVDTGVLIVDKSNVEAFLGD